MDAGDYPEDDDRNDDAKPTPEEAEESGPIYPCTALAVFKILELFRSSSSARGAYRHRRRQQSSAPLTTAGAANVTRAQQ